MLLHATTIAIDNRAVLITGVSGIGKSDLALRFIIEQGSQLVADDQTELHVTEGKLCASPPPQLAGLMEVRHVGLLRVPYVMDVPVTLCVELVGADVILERLPAFDNRQNNGQGAQVMFWGHAVPFLKLPSFAASTMAKICAALQFEQA